MAATQALIAGEIQLAQVTGVSTSGAILAGADVRIVASSLNRIVGSIYARPDLGTTDFTVSCQLILRRTPYIEFLFVRSSLWLRLPSDPSSQRRPCLRLAVGVPSPAEDLHLQETQHAWRTKKASRNLLSRLAF